MKDSYFVFVKYITPTTMILGGLASVSFLILLLALIFSLGGVRGNLLGAGSVSYDFEADSIGATPANTTVLAGSVQVANSPESSNALNFTGTENNSNTPGSASLSLVRLDSVPAESEDITVTWQQSYNTGARSGPLLRWDDSTKNGYLFQVNDNSMNDLRIYRIMGTGAHTTLATAPLAGQSPRWFRASITGAQLTFEYSNDGISYTEAISHTDSSELNTEGPVVWSAGYGALGDVYLDDITVDYTTASSADGQLVLSYTGDGLAVSEGGSGDSYTVALIEAPTDDVVVSIAPADNVTGAAVSPTTLTFTPSDWETPQLVNVSAIDDSVVEFMHFDAIEHTVSSDDSNYDGVTVSPLRVTIKDNDTPQSGYDFSLDTVGSNNPGATTTLTGSYQVSSDPAMGNAITPSSYNSNGLDYSANLATIRFDNASTSATDVGVTWR